MCIYIYIYISSKHKWFIPGQRYARPGINHLCEGLLAATYNNPFSKVLSSLPFYPFSFSVIGLRPSTYSAPFL